MNELLKSALPVAVIVSVPSLMALLGILFNRQDLAKLESRLENRFDKLDGRIDRLDSRMDSLNDKVDRLRDTLHSDIQQLLRMDAEKDVRIARLESRP